MPQNQLHSFPLFLVQPIFPFPTAHFPTLPPFLLHCRFDPTASSLRSLIQLRQQQPAQGLKILLADLISQANPHPRGPSVPSTPISPTTGDAGHGDSLSLLGHASHAHGQTEDEDQTLRPTSNWLAHPPLPPAIPPPAAPSSSSSTRVSTLVPEDDDDAVEALHPSAASPNLAPPAAPSSAFTHDPSTPAKRSFYHGRSASIATGSPYTSLSTPPPASHAASAYARGADLLFSPQTPQTISPSFGASPSSPSHSPSHDRPRTASAAPPLTNATTGSTVQGSPPPRLASISSAGTGPSGPSRRDSTRDRDRERSGGGGEGAASTSASSRSRRQLGEWKLTKTLGTGSMGKVKLGVSVNTGEKVAIKIIPRFTSTASAHRRAADHQPKHEAASTASEPPPRPSASFLAKAAAKDASKEVRTVREGSLCLLLHHPYVCGMREMLVYPHHHHFVQEYINGGYMLDYIISHGRLRERSARTFTRQIGSSREYCHALCIMHQSPSGTSCRASRQLY
ncbi:hypothetical protein JCM8097_008802 [Rhodosporidiobolus ruineniae]